MVRVIMFFLSILVCTESRATTLPYPGQCTVSLYAVSTATSTYARSSITLDSSGRYQYGAFQTYPTGKTGYMAANWYKCNDTCPESNPGSCWCVSGQTSAVTYIASAPPGTNVGNVATVNPANVNHILPYLVCGNNCNQKANQPIYDDNENYPVLVGLPYHAPYYQTVGACVEGCKAVPVGPVILNQYASDGSGYTVGPWAFTGDECTVGMPAPPDQPEPEEVCASQRNACEAQCAGKAYTFECETGSCECFGAPSYNTDPPVEPTEPTPDPATPSAPTQQTAVADPGGDAQSSAQIANQAKQIQQQNDQNTQLGSLNNKLSAMISNQAKALGQGDKIIDYNRQQLGVLKDIRDKLNEDSTGSNPGVPGSVNYDSSIGNEKDWGEHDNFSQVGHDRAEREQALQSASPEMPLSFSLHASGGPALSGQMFGRTVEIRFDRPWMETGYSLMKVLLIGIGYLQVFLMVNRTILNDR